MLGVCAAVLSAALGSAQAGVGQAPDCTRPYSDASPWNTPIAGATYAADSAAKLNAIGGNLSSDPTQYTYPVYYADASTPRRTVTINGAFSQTDPSGSSFANSSRTSVQAPIPAGAAPAAGSDAQVIIIDRSTNQEWGFYNFSGSGGSYVAQNGYVYNIGADGVPSSASGVGFVARGAGVPYLAGLVRPCEIQRGAIEHALAFAYDAPAATFVYPATKSDGAGSGLGALPEGTRLQLDPALNDAQIGAWGCAGACLTIARALQRYGMFVVDNSGRAKVMMEFDGTAGWNGAVSGKTASPIPLSAFKVIESTSGAGTPPPSTGTPPGGSPAPPPAEQAKKKAKKVKKAKKKVKRNAKGSKRLTVDRYRLKGRSLRAGRKFDAQVTFAARARSGRLPAGLRVRCPARIGSSIVPLASAKLTRTARGRRVRAVCRWAVPKGTDGQAPEGVGLGRLPRGRDEDQVCREDPQGSLSSSPRSPRAGSPQPRRRAVAVRRRPHGCAGATMLAIAWSSGSSCRHTA